MAAQSPTRTARACATPRPQKIAGSAYPRPPFLLVDRAVVLEQRASRRRNHSLRNDASAAAKRCLKHLFRIVGEDILAQCQHLLHGAVVLGDKLDDPDRGNADKPVNNVIKRHITSDRQMMLECKSDQCIRLRTAGKARTL